MNKLKEYPQFFALKEISANLIKGIGVWFSWSGYFGTHKYLRSPLPFNVKSYQDQRLSRSEGFMSF